MIEKRKMKEIRCPLCKKKLCMTNGDIEIKCARCGVIVVYKVDTEKFVTYKEPNIESNSGRRF